ncbi:MAG: dihydroorotate dehydrogenase-like protein [Tenuifilaceae bacterium]|jgi:dihydroorotate dehydrogenase (fumarate)|nr:dihydroorotate dehydrogenase-like protein [Bacteroidales bacterium]MDI9516576.1 dihydroorotate dehydrogenase-like protein [Bacteroidota bacterium]NLH57137.1 dihydroorotate dehydrogenase-like protein [Rikenellaceae bacterium]OQC61806.1 MAG: Dihydroorotate dehydrogenase A (fumarate) [Bacteroidetes bacterium ADurb.Bin008]HNV80516.1 dihydroorotate dehydrogenase-like protein [Tenuifilaceae bacterium]
MANLITNYLGLKLKNPVIVSSSGLTSNLESIKQLEKNGAAAVVLKSLFEEQILNEAGVLSGQSDYPEAEDYLKAYVTSNNVSKYLELITKAKESVNIPVIASINCVDAYKWIDFAAQIQQAGADALEINVFLLPSNINKTADEYESVYFDLAEKLKKVITIPISFKLGNHFTNPIRIIQQLWFRKVRGVTLFNRFFAPDIDIDKLKVIPAEVFSSPTEIRDILRWVAIASHEVPEINISASTGIHNGDAAIKMLLAGATTLQVCSTLYIHGASHLGKIIEFIEKWMDGKGYKSIDDFRGLMSYKNIGDPEVYERSQFMRHFSAHE